LIGDKPRCKQNEGVGCVVLSEGVGLPGGRFEEGGVWGGVDGEAVKTGLEVNMGVLRWVGWDWIEKGEKEGRACMYFITYLPRWVIAFEELDEVGRELEELVADPIRRVAEGDAAGGVLSRHLLFWG
jgi:hypothetical protein